MCLIYGIEIPSSDWEKTPPSIKELVEKMGQRIKQSEQELADKESKNQQLLEKINRTSKNSSSPPSSDPLNSEKQKQKKRVIKSEVDSQDIKGIVAICMMYPNATAF